MDFDWPLSEASFALTALAFQQQTQGILQARGLHGVVGRCQYVRYIFGPGFGWRRIVAAGEQLQLQGAACIQMLGRRGGIGTLSDPDTPGGARKPGRLLPGDALGDASATATPADPELR